MCKNGGWDRAVETGACASSAQLTSLASALFDPFEVGDVIMTRLAVVKSSEETERYQRISKASQRTHSDTQEIKPEELRVFLERGAALRPAPLCGSFM